MKRSCSSVAKRYFSLSSNIWRRQNINCHRLVSCWVWRTGVGPRPDHNPPGGSTGQQDVRDEACAAQKKKQNRNRRSRTLPVQCIAAEAEIARRTTVRLAWSVCLTCMSCNNLKRWQIFFGNPEQPPLGQIMQQAAQPFDVYFLIKRRTNLKNAPMPPSRSQSMQSFFNYQYDTLLYGSEPLVRDFGYCFSFSSRVDAASLTIVWRRMKVWREIMYSPSSRRFVLPRITGPLGYQEIAQLGQPNTGLAFAHDSL
jgi:hypothetical protein